MLRPLCQCLLALSLATSGCATLLNAGGSHLSIDMAPGTATGLLQPDDGTTVTTLTGAHNTVTLDRGHAYRLNVAQPGYAPQAVTIDRQVTQAFWGNLAIVAVGLASLIPGIVATDNSGLSRGLSLLVGLPVVLAGGVGAGLIDAATGAMWDHSPRHVSVSLSPAPRLP